MTPHTVTAVPMAYRYQEKYSSFPLFSIATSSFSEIHPTTAESTNQVSSSGVNSDAVVTSLSFNPETSSRKADPPIAGIAR